MATLATPHWEAVTAGSRELLITLGQVDWEQVKAFFVSEARRLGQEWFAGHGTA